MSQAGTHRQEPTPIGVVPKPPFARVPDPTILFAARAARMRSIAENHELKPYLLFLAELIQAQNDVQEGLVEPELPAPDTLARAREFGMPPLDRTRFTADAAFDETFDRIVTRAQTIEMPQAARDALARVVIADYGMRAAMIANVLADAIPVEALAEHVFVAAAMQVHFVRLAGQLEAKSLVPIGDTAICPACGGPPAASMVVGWQGAEGTRYCSCALCATLWNYVRIKCCLCGTTKGISYEEVEGAGGLAKAETCDSCRSYLKIFHQHKDTSIEPLADDIATLGLDLLMKDTEYRRGGFNPFLLGY